MADSDRRDYAVGRGKPPREHQWQKGQSGNRKGRPRRQSAGGIDQCVWEILEEMGTIPSDQGPRRIKYGRAVALKLIQLAIKGDRGAIREVHRMQREYAGRNHLDLPQKIQFVFADEPDLYQIELQKNAELRQEIETLKAQLEARPGYSQLPPFKNGE